MKIALAVPKIIDGNIRHNISKMKYFMYLAKSNGADLVCFGEAFLQGFNCLTWNYETDKDIAISTGSEIFKQICELSKKIGIDVMFGYNELYSGSVYSSCAFIMNGVLHYNYRRISQGWKEASKTDHRYKEGDSVDTFEYMGKKCVIALCGDLWDHPKRFALNEDILFWGVYVAWTVEEWENGGKLEYARQANKCCKNTLYINSICEDDAFGGAEHFVNGNITDELPLQNEDFIMVTV